MAKKHRHEEHTNHEAWAIPYGDLVTLLLALFVVMYSMSAVNEGKFRVAADSLNAAFHGPPRTVSIVEVGPKPTGQAQSSDGKPAVVPGTRASGALVSPPLPLPNPAAAAAEARRNQAKARQRERLAQMSDAVEKAMGDLISKNLVVVRRHESWLEVEMQTDIIFASGSAQIGAAALPVIDRLAGVLKPFDSHLRIEGHTDDRPISTREFPSNWELSSARAASVVHRFMAEGVDPHRMTVMGLAEYQPAGDNLSPEGRNRNRRVVVVITANPDDPELAELQDRDPAPDADSDAGPAPEADPSQAGGDGSLTPDPAGAEPAPPPSATAEPSGAGATIQGPAQP